MPLTQEALVARLWDLHRAGARPALAVMGGTFDPIHLGHTAMAQAACAELALDGILFVPAGNPNFKQGRKIAPAASRLEMAKLAVRALPNCAVSALETERPGVTYTYDTLLELRRLLPPEARLVFVMGADSLQTFAAWHRAADLARLAEYAVAPRAGSLGLADLRAGLARKGLEPVLHELATPLPTVSSTQVRALLATGDPTDGLLDPVVARHIAEHGLYAASASSARGKPPHSQTPSE